MPIIELTQQTRIVGGEIVIDDKLSDDSINALQNRVIKEELDGKAPKEHSHSYEGLTEKLKWIELE